MSYLPGTILEYNRGGVISSVMVLTNGKAYLSPHPDKEVMSSKATVELADWLLFANGKEKIRVPASPISLPAYPTDQSADRLQKLVSPL